MAAAINRAGKSHRHPKMALTVPGGGAERLPLEK
jgi:hypothetical protein